MSDNHAKFLASLDESMDAVWTAARWLQSKGYRVTVNPMSRALTRDQASAHIDGGDLHIQQRIEVKHLSYHFTCREDWPFTKFIVCACHQYDAQADKPHGWIMYNPDKTAWAVVMADSKDRWTVETITDRRYREAQRKYVAPLDVVKFYRST